VLCSNTRTKDTSNKKRGKQPFIYAPKTHTHTHNFKELENKLGGPSKKRVNENVPGC